MTTKKTRERYKNLSKDEKQRLLEYKKNIIKTILRIIEKVF